MDERELRAAMDRAVAVAPPPMDEAPVLSAGRQALKRRRAVRASGWTAAAVVAVAAGVTALAPGQDQGTVAQLASAPATSRPADPAEALAAALDEVAPEGYGTPDDLKGVDDFADRTLKGHITTRTDDPGVWYHAASTPLTRGDAAGELLAAVYSPGWGSGEHCSMSKVPWDQNASSPCRVVTVGGRKVAVVDVPSADLLPPSQWAGYRHLDGTAVFVMQSTGMARAGRPALDQPPMTAEQLAAVATDPRLKVG